MYSLPFNPLITLHFIIYTIGVFTISIIWVQLGPQTETETQRINQMQQVQIRSIKEGGYFSKRENGPEYIRNHYNRKDAFGPACFSVSRCDDMNSETFLKPSKLVWVD
tara:strand:+ start:185 stop:508 length:324 start_codon:yes stop_codon:yes gene_type:complete